jgi:serine/threonine protein kinase
LHCTQAINEVKLLASMDSPFVVRYYDSFINKDNLAIIMEFCNKGDLQRLIKKAKASGVTSLLENVLWNISLQILLGLYYLHSKKVLHRDLKSANVFLSKDASQKYFSVKIGDLGVAKLLDTSTAFAKTIVGTPYYLSPELCSDQPYRDKSDVWAFGVILYECCSFRHPFEAGNQCALILKIIQSPVPPLPKESNVSPEIYSMVQWTLQKDPFNRPTVRDILCEGAVQRHIREHRFELPDGIPVYDGSPAHRHVGSTEASAARSDRKDSGGGGGARPMGSNLGHKSDPEERNMLEALNPAAAPGKPTPSSRSAGAGAEDDYADEKFERCEGEEKAPAGGGSDGKDRGDKKRSGSGSDDDDDLIDLDGGLCLYGQYRSPTAQSSKDKTFKAAEDALAASFKNASLLPSSSKLILHPNQSPSDSGDSMYVTLADPALIDAVQQKEVLVKMLSDARDRLVSSLGRPLFDQLYSLCREHMSDDSIGDAESSNTKLMHQIEGAVCDQLEGGIEAACEAVIGIKVILALEGRLENFGK